MANENLGLGAPVDYSAEIKKLYAGNTTASAYNPQGASADAMAYWNQKINAEGLDAVKNGGFSSEVNSYAKANPLDYSADIQKLYADNKTATAYNPNGVGTDAMKYWNDQINQKGLASVQNGGFNSAVADYATANPLNTPEVLAARAAPVQQSAPATQAAAANPATSNGYQATNTDLAQQYNSMGQSAPTAANQQLLSGQVNNQYLDAQANNIQMRLNRNLQENIMPGIGQGATGAGQYGGSRQGIAQGKAIADTQDNYAGQMANLYGSANEAAQNRMGTAAGNLSGIGAQVGMSNASNSNAANQFGAQAGNTASMFNTGQTNAQNQFNAGQTNATNQFNAGQANSYALGSAANANNANQTANSFTLGQGNQALTNQGQMQNFYTANRGLDQSGLQLGANLYNMGNTGNVAAGSGQAALGNQYQNAPLTALQNYSNSISPYSGLGSTQSTTSNSGGGAVGAIGGALAGAQIGSNLGFGSANAASPTNQLVTAGGYSNIPAYMIQNGG